MATGVSEQTSMFPSAGGSVLEALKKNENHDSHPSLDRLVMLVFEAVMEVVCVSLPGYVIARLGYFDAEKQKFLANLNVMLFTPCLIFTKLASQLNADKLLDLGIIPVIFIIQTLVSYLVSTGVAHVFGFNKRASNFVRAMGVFGNSNSLPISLVLSLSQTIAGLHWDKIPGDNDDEVAARGILYLLIFQQLGQLVRWSWGYHVLLAPKDKYAEYSTDDDDNVTVAAAVEEGRYDGEPHDDQETQGLIKGIDSVNEMGGEAVGTAVETETGTGTTHGTLKLHHKRTPTAQSSDSAGYEPAGCTPVVGTSRASPNDSEDESDAPRKRRIVGPALLNNSVHGSHRQLEDGTHAAILSRIHSICEEPENSAGLAGLRTRINTAIGRHRARTSNAFIKYRRHAVEMLPKPLRKTCRRTARVAFKVVNFLWEFMNPPLWAMLLAVIVASVPKLQSLFFCEGSFIRNSVTAAVASSGGVAVPLILVVLGANLARNTQMRDEAADDEEKALGTKLLVASLISRMLLPTLLMAPVLAAMAKFIPVSTLDDPIFIIVCFLLTGAPSALQLAQICQINGVFEGVMGRVLFQSYVVWILPSTLVLVICALEVVEWAKLNT